MISQTVIEAQEVHRIYTAELSFSDIYYNSQYILLLITLFKAISSFFLQLLAFSFDQNGPSAMDYHDLHRGSSFWLYSHWEYTLCSVAAQDSHSLYIIYSWTDPLWSVHLRMPFSSPLYRRCLLTVMSEDDWWVYLKSFHRAAQ